jgi:hypothetical protein
VGQGRQALEGDPTPAVHDHCVEQGMWDCGVSAQFF